MIPERIANNIGMRKENRLISRDEDCPGFYIENSYNMLDVWKSLDASRSLWKQFILVLIIFLAFLFFPLNNHEKSICFSILTPCHCKSKIGSALLTRPCHILICFFKKLLCMSYTKCQVLDCCELKSDISHRNSWTLFKILFWMGE